MIVTEKNGHKALLYQNNHGNVVNVNTFEGLSVVMNDIFSTCKTKDELDCVRGNLEEAVRKAVKNRSLEIDAEKREAEERAAALEAKRAEVKHTEEKIPVGTKVSARLGNIQIELTITNVRESLFDTENAYVYDAVDVLGSEYTMYREEFDVVDKYAEKENPKCNEEMPEVDPTEREGCYEAER